MNAKLAYWYCAFGLMLVVIFLALVGYRKIRQGKTQAHMTLMNWVTGLILFFVVSYLGKATILGREDKSSWDMFYLVVLRIHELLILGMLVFGGYARYLAGRFKARLLIVQPSTEDRLLRKKHAKSGRLAVILCMLAVFTAGIVLYGMTMNALA